MSKFKAGDKVRCINAKNNSALIEGEVYTVHGHCSIYKKLDMICIKEIPSTYFPAGSVDSSRFELIEKETMKKLTNQELIKILNKGMQAGRELRKRDCGARLQYTFATDDGEVWCRSKYSFEEVYRLDTPKPVFEPFKIGAWDVRLEGNTLHIGCESFDARLLTKELPTLVQGNASACGSFVATRRGVRWSEHLVSWDNAAKLLVALQKAFRE